MIVVYHQNNKVTQISSSDNKNIVVDNYESIASALLVLAARYPKSKIVWCDELLRSYLDVEKIPGLFHHNKMMLSYSMSENWFLGTNIGYVEESPFIKVNKLVRYPTWQMSSEAGVIHASVLNLIGTKIKREPNFDYFLNSVAKLGMFVGLFCYSEPQLLLKNAPKINKPEINGYILFRFVKQHYKKRWLLLLWLNLLLFEKQLVILPLLYALLFRSRREIRLNLDTIEVQSILKVVNEKTIDVIIPTIGRKQYLYDVLKDLSRQTHLPKNVIVVEQNPDKESVSELDYITNESWPFAIKHIFTHQAGVCHARNLALRHVESEWVFLADDDILFENEFFEKAIDKVAQYGVFVSTTSCLQPKEIQEYKIIHQSGIFGSGNSFVKKVAVAHLSFDKALEFGYGEDTDFGLQLRNQGHDVIYFPDLKITHLKAPIGGFRTKIKKQWDSETIQPKPSPTILYVLQKHYTLQQLKSYKLVLFLKLLKKESVKNYFSFYKSFKQKWCISIYWANQLSDKTE